MFYELSKLCNTILEIKSAEYYYPPTLHQILCKELVKHNVEKLTIQQVQELYSRVNPVVANKLLSIQRHKGIITHQFIPILSKHYFFNDIPPLIIRLLSWIQVKDLVV